MNTTVPVDLGEKLEIKSEKLENIRKLTEDRKSSEYEIVNCNYHYWNI